MPNKPAEPAKIASRLLDEAVAGSIAINAVKNSFQYMVTPAKDLYGAGKKIFGPWKRLNILPDDVTDAAERFQMAARAAASVSRAGDAEIEKRIKVAGRRFEFWSYFSMAILAVLVLTFGSPLFANFILGHHPHILGQLMIALIASSFISQAVKLAFWSAQLRRGALISFLEWVRSPDDWIPPDAGAARRVFRVLPWVVPLGLLAVPHHAVAQAVTSSSMSAQSIIQSLLGNLPTTDLSLQWMNRLFPSAMSTTGSTSGSGVSYQDDAIAQMMYAMNTVLLGLAGGMLTWHTIAGLVNTATDGSVLGERWHAMWAPARIIVGVSSTAPIQGYCAAQLLVIKIILASYGLANVAWTTYLDAATGISSTGGTSTNTESLVVAPVMDTQEQLLYAAISDQACVDMARWIYRPAGTTAELSVSQLQSDVPPSNGLTGVQLFQQPSTGTSNADGSVTFSWGTVCGSVTYPAPPNTAGEVANQAAAAAGNISAPSSTTDMQLGITFPSITSNANNDSAVSQFYTTRQSDFSTFVGSYLASTSNVAEDMAQTNVPSTGTTVAKTAIVTDLGTAETGFKTYMTGVTSAAATLGTSVNGSALTTLNQEGTTLGWASAGAIQSQIVMLNDVVASAASSTAQVTMPSFSDLGTGSGEKEMQAAYSQAMSTIATAMNGDAALNPGVNNTGSAGSGSTPPTISGDVFLKALKSGGDPIRAIGEAMGGGHTMYNLLSSGPASLSPINPMGDMISEGEWMKGVGYGIEFALATAMGAAQAGTNASGDLSGIPILGPLVGGLGGGLSGAMLGVLNAVAQLVNQLSMTMIIMGGMMEIVLPMLQYLIWMSAIAGLMVFAVEAVVGAAFWAFAHVRADGSDFINQQQGYGYSILLNAIFRPLLTLVGLVFSSVIMAVMAQFVDETFALAFANTGVGTIWDPVSIILIFGLLFYVHYQVCLRSLRTITLLPDAILRWIGSGVSASSYEMLNGEEMQGGFHGVVVAKTQGMSLRPPPKPQQPTPDPSKDKNKAQDSDSERESE